MVNKSRAQRRLKSIFTHDFASWADPYISWVKKPLGMLVFAGLLSVVTGRFIAPQGYVVLAAIGVVLFLGIAWPWIGLRGLRCELRFERGRASEGTPVRTVITVHSRWPWPVWGMAIENGFFEMDPDDNSATVALARVGGWSRSEFQWTFVPECRGLYPTSPPTITTGFPFGLWTSRKSILVAHQLSVWPKTFRLAPRPLPAGGQQWFAAEASDFQPGDQGDRSGVRPYRRGDRLRNIHWALTARHGRFIVSERQAVTEARVRINVDVEHLSAYGSGPESALEWSIRLAATMTRRMVEQNTRCHVLLGRHVMEVAPCESGLRRFFDALARFGADDIDPLPKLSERYRSTEPDLSVLVSTAEGAGSLASTPFDVSVIFLPSMFDAAAEAFWHDDHLPSSVILIERPEDVSRRFADQWDLQCKEVWSGV